ncbi:hypothetical protein OAS39_00190 [Pirellulales bacterium]|nr:hypothetical protein [Pirellulales bacterium]
MPRLRPAILLLVSVSVASVGCRTCSNCYDYSSPVANSAYSHESGRAGSAISRNIAAVGRPDLDLDLQIPAEAMVDLNVVPNAPTYLSESPGKSRTPALTLPWSTGGMMVR